jgi:hypothetical protein
MGPDLTPTVSLGGTSAVVSGCGHDRGHIEHRVAQELTGHWATPEGPADRPPHRHPPHAPPPRPRPAASWPASAAAPEGLYRAHPTPRCGTPLGSPTGGATPSSLPRSSGCDAQKQNLRRPRRNNRQSQQVARVFLGLGSKSFRLKFSRCCSDGGPLFASSRWLLHTG